MSPRCQACHCHSCSTAAGWAGGMYSSSCTFLWHLGQSAGKHWFLQAKWHPQHTLTLLLHPRSFTWVTKQVSCPTQDRPVLFHQALTGIIKRQGDKVMHSDIKHVFLSAEQLLCHSSEQKVALLTGRTQPTCSYAHEDTTVPASGPGTEAHTEATQ